MAKLKFERTAAPTGSVEFQRNPSRGDISHTPYYLQPQDISDGGDVYIYDKGLVLQDEVPISFRNISALDLTNFQTFHNIVVGSKYSFTVTDIDGTTFTARLLDGGKYNAAPIAPGRYSLSFKLRRETDAQWAPSDMFNIVQTLCIAPYAAPVTYMVPGRRGR